MLNQIYKQYDIPYDLYTTLKASLNVVSSTEI